MKLYELISFDPKKSSVDPEQYKSKIKYNTQSTRRGAGSFGTVYDVHSNKRLNQVTKVGKAGSISDRSAKIKKIKNDGYLAYLHAIHTSGIKNPYFPRIYDLKILKGADGALSYRANIEKLVAFNSEKIVDNDDLMASLYDDMFNEETTYYKDYGPGAGIKFTLDNISTSGKLGIVKDPDLLEALRLIDTVVKSNKLFVADLHSGNIMWRITGSRPQLVIVDPVA